MSAEHLTAQQLEDRTREALRALAIELGADPAPWATHHQARLALLHGARAGATFPDLLQALASLPATFRAQGLTGARFDAEVGPFLLCAALNDALRAQAERREEREAEAEAETPPLTVMECR